MIPNNFTIILKIFFYHLNDALKCFMAAGLQWMKNQL